MTPRGSGEPVFRARGITKVYDMGEVQLRVIVHQGADVEDGVRVAIDQ